MSDSKLKNESELRPLIRFSDTLKASDTQFQFDIPEILDRVEEELQNVLLGLDTVTTASRVGREVVSQIKITNFLIKNVLLVEEENHGALSEPGVPQNGVKQSDGLL